METATEVRPYHVMIDLETLGNGNDAAVWSIGAVKFSLSDPAFVWKNFYMVLDVENAVRLGLKMDPSTVLWWMKPENTVAREQLLSDKNKIDLVTGLQAFGEWMLEEPNHKLTGVWGNGATFDNVILRHAYTQAGLPCPWGFRADRCFRTMNQMFPMDSKPRIGTHHNALDDAINQTNHLVRIVEMLKHHIPHWSE